MAGILKGAHVVTGWLWSHWGGILALDVAVVAGMLLVAAMVEDDLPRCRRPFGHNHK